ncbi:peptidase S1 [Alteromonas macleodii]|uniref:Peptidase S1 n=1 Tax=Alteromonas macleodii TaxID=28108 RepID=A0A126Q5K2_ALTMA|nr:peptidase S1 [Alteromonas macleodii]|tara:strand:+ start:1444 stop:2217 length:774 start_codon:yes stop_codon:yes gene_type:complete
MVGSLNKLTLFCTIFLLTTSTYLRAEQGFIDVVENVTQSTVAIALDAPYKHASPRVLGTGFIVDDGSYAITNYHVVSETLDPKYVENYVVLSGEGTVVKKVKAEIIKIDLKHDLALLKLDSTLTPITLSPKDMLRPGTEIAFTGFPIGAILGIYPATHRGYISAITPDAIPAINSQQLNLKMMQRLDSVSMIYQLDAIAYPGNSGSPMYDPKSGEVVGVINKVLVKDTKESALSSPTGISYAIPVKHVHKLISDVTN